MIIAYQIVGSYYIVHAITSTCIYKFIKVLWILWKCIVYGYAYVPRPPPPPQGFINVHVSAEKFKVTSTCEK